MKLFDESKKDLEFVPLSERMRPTTWTEFIGQENIVGQGKILREAIEQDKIPSMVFWGPPGSGKTSLARLIAQITKSHFVQFSAVSGSVKQVREIVEVARKRQELDGKRTILFVDEVHRFNKGQQDAFLPHVEDGTIILIGATTENPSFEVISALLSRSRVFVLQPHSPEEIKKIINQALKDKERGYGKRKIIVEKKALGGLALASNGDARIALNTLEFIVDSQKKSQAAKINIDETDIKEALQKTALIYDKDGDEHYNTISAFIKSMRAGVVDAALYYLARMVAAGEEPKFIARRMVVFASEDVGMAQPTALVVANEVFRAVETIGYPECGINLAHGVAYLSLAKKDRSSYNAYLEAMADVKQYGNLPIPLSLRNA